MPAEQFNAMAQALGTISAATYPDTVTFSRISEAKGSAGGNTRSAANTSPAAVPVRYRPASGKEVALAGKAISATAYMLCVAASFSAALVDVDSKCQAIVAARAGAEPSRTFNVEWIGRYEGLEIQILATIEE